MTIGIVGRKCGMTRLFREDGASIPVTVVEATPNHVTSLLTQQEKGYSAVQVSWGSKKTNGLMGRVLRRGGQIFETCHCDLCHVAVA